MSSRRGRGRFGHNAILGHSGINRNLNRGRGYATLVYVDNDIPEMWWEYENNTTGRVARLSSRVIRADYIRLDLTRFYEEICAVCQCAITRYCTDDDQKLIITNCKHAFHDECFRDMLTYDTRVCPICNCSLTWFIENILNEIYYTITTILD